MNEKRKSGLTHMAVLGFRQSMTLLHTWAGVVIGSLLFAIFWMGSLSVFDKELDRWMNPSTRFSHVLAEDKIQLDGAVAATANVIAKGSSQWYVRLPSDRVPVIELRWRDDKQKIMLRRYLHPITGEVLVHTNTLAGTGFIFPFHYNLHLKWKDVGYWFVGLAAMSMLILIISGVVIHRKILTDFFLFRPKRKIQRASLDLHNLTAVIGLPFYFVMAFSGLVIFIAIYWPSSYSSVYPQTKDIAAARTAFNAEGYGQFRRAKTGTLQLDLVSLDNLRQSARQRWNGGYANFIRVWHPGDEASYVELRRSYADSVTMTLDQLYFDADSGQELYNFTAKPIMSIQRFISGLHFIQFDHWLLRWLYFFGGLAGCIMIASGFVFWIESRRANHQKKGLYGVRLVEALTVASVTGIMIATCTFLIANRLLPLNANAASFDRAELEVLAFYIAWIVTFIHAFWRLRQGWVEQTLGLAILAIVAILLNWLTTGHHIVYAVQHQLWAIVGVDSLLVITAALSFTLFKHLRSRANAASVSALIQPTHVAGNLRHG